MGSLSKSFALILILIMSVSSVSLLMVMPVSAQSIPTPAIPQFTLSFSTQFEPPQKEYTTNPYTNVTTVGIIPGYTVLEIDVTVKNQAFPSAVNGNALSLYYDVRVKPHFEEDDWVDQFPSTHGYFDQVQATNTSGGISQSGTELTYTVIQIDASSFQPGYEIDVQAEAILGYYYIYAFIPFWNGAQAGPPETVASFFAQSSGWSTTQTIIIPANSTSASPSPTSTSTAAVPELSWIVVVPLLLSTFSVVVMIRHRKTAHLSK